MRVNLRRQIFSLTASILLSLAATASLAQGQQQQQQPFLPDFAAPSQQPFVCDEGLTGAGSASFVSSSGRFSLELTIAEQSRVQVGSVFKNVYLIPLEEIAIDYKGQTNETFGPFLVVTYKVPKGKISGRVLPFSGQPGTQSPSKGYTRISFTRKDMNLPVGTTLQGMEIIAIGENGGGSVTLSDVFINGEVVKRSLNTLNSCDVVP